MVHFCGEFSGSNCRVFGDCVIERNGKYEFTVIYFERTKYIMEESSNWRNKEYSIGMMKIEEINVERGSMASDFCVIEHPRSIKKSLEFPASVLWRKMEDCNPQQKIENGFPDLELINCLQTEIEVKCHIRTYACSCELVTCEDHVDERKMNRNNVETIALFGISSGRLNLEKNWNNVETIACIGTLSERLNLNWNFVETNKWNRDNQIQSIKLEPLPTVELHNQLVQLTLTNYGSVKKELVKLSIVDCESVEDWKNRMLTMTVEVIENNLRSGENFVLARIDWLHQCSILNLTVKSFVIRDLSELKVN